MHIDAVERVQNPFVTQINLVFRADYGYQFIDGFNVLSTDGKIFNLSGDEHLEAVVDTIVQASLMGCGFETVAR